MVLVTTSTPEATPAILNPRDFASNLDGTIFSSMLGNGPEGNILHYVAPAARVEFERAYADFEAAYPGLMNDDTTTRLFDAFTWLMTETYSDALRHGAEIESLRHSIVSREHMCPSCEGKDRSCTTCDGIGVIAISGTGSCPVCKGTGGRMTYYGQWSNCVLCKGAGSF